MAVHVIPPYRLKQAESTVQESLRVAAYCRVSTDLEEQESSYDAQVAHYTELISRTPSWVLAGIYSDEGISGTSTAKREGFHKMLKDCEERKIDYIITKSISRFARNTLDALENIRKLKALGIPVYFEKENLNTITSTGELLLTILASLAQQESQSISMNVGMGIRYRFQAGKPMLNHTQFLGYTKNRGENLRIVDEEALTVQYIYRGYLEGMSIPEIIAWLEAQKIHTACGKEKWDYSVVRSILTNEKYMGDLLLQKTYTVDFLSKKRQKNRGQLPQYYVKNVHDAIIPRDVFYYVQGLLCQRKTAKRRMHSVLHGLVICVKCGSKYVRFTDKKYGQTWRCKGRYERQNGCPCSAPPVRESELRGAIINAFNQLPKHRDGLLTNKKQLQEVLGSDILIQVNMIDSQIERIENALQYAAGDTNSAVTDPVNTPAAVQEFREQISALQGKKTAYLSVKGTLAMRLAQTESLLRLTDGIEGKPAAPVKRGGSCTNLSDFYLRTDMITQYGPVQEFDEWMVRRYIDNIKFYENAITVHFKEGLAITICKDKNRLNE